MAEVDGREIRFPQRLIEAINEVRDRTGFGEVRIIIERGKLRRIIVATSEQIVDELNS